MAKEKFMYPKINISESRRLYEKKTETYNLKFFDSNGKFVRYKSKKHSIMHKEVFVALYAIMNARLKTKNISNKRKCSDNNIEDFGLKNYTRDPFIFSVSTLDIQNMITQNQTEKKEISRTTIKRALYRFYNDSKFITRLQWRRSKSRYDVIIDPKIVHFQEVYPSTQNTCKSTLKNSKNTNSPNYTICNTKVNNNKSNHTDLLDNKNLQANFNLDNTKNKNKKEQGESVINDNRTLKEKRSDHEETVIDLTEKIKSSGDKRSSGEISKKIRTTLPEPKKTKQFNKSKIDKINADFLRYKQKVVRDFYILMLNMLWKPELVKIYSPYNIQSPMYIYTEQAITELENNSIYFGECKTLDDFEQRKILLENSLIEMKKGWLNKRKSFNSDYLYPNRYINGSYDFMKFENAVFYYIEKKNKKRFKKRVKTEKKVNLNQYNGLMNRFVDAMQKGNNIKSIITQKFFITYGKSDESIGIKPRKQFSKNEIYKAMQYYFL